MKIFLIDDDESRLRELRHLLNDLPSVGFVEVEKAIYMNPPGGLDAVFMTLPAAERWNPNFRSREMQVLETSSEDQKKGFPPLVITGVSLRPEDPHAPISQVRIILEEAITAARAYNEQNSEQIRSLGFWVRTLAGAQYMGQRRVITMEHISQLLHQLLPTSGSPELD